MIAFPWSRRAAVADPPRHGVHRFARRHLPGAVLYLLIAVFAAIVLWPYMVVNVPSGQVGVMWKRFSRGTVLDPTKLRSEGFHIILPWDRMFLYNLRIQTVTQTYHAISSDGVGLLATVNIRFRLRREFIPFLHQAIGPAYLELLGPEVASRMREVISQYTAEQVYSTDRGRIQDEIKNRVIEKLGDRFLERDGGAVYRVSFQSAGVLYDTLLNEIKLPPEVVAAINRKAEQYYMAQEYAYRVDRERRETERKKIEAEGISAFQKIVSQGISDSYLRWRGIEATLELSKSNNAKIVIIGAGKEGMPLILGNVDPPPAPSANAGTGPGAPGAAPAEGAVAPGQPPSMGPVPPGPVLPTPGPAGAQPDRHSALESGYARVRELFALPWDQPQPNPGSGPEPGARPEPDTPPTH